ncbi:uncharacterized protein KGF55_004640 [Candida pseudojiufengensis]|uniref:uncharacterized protein n=1 Tax=Candida pseudojiufengensis TaxID=497109 RepID=UPI0022240A26|nr:uncharacterized protein KGF55_004640 [Candida pseudojiufengensis]KAI5960348.1 hypothetical protein KGF55_004640 [Candida pseudojiufengensis]
MSFPPEDVTIIVHKIAEILRSKNQTLAISEAACGGLISSYLVSEPGASDFYIGGKLLYSLKQRLKLNGWSDLDIKNYMGPSENVVLKFARTAKYELGSTFVLSETGFAGPSTDLHLVDENDEKDVNKEKDETNDNEKENKSKAEVGTVFVGFTGPNGDSSTTRNFPNQSRNQNMTDFAKFALEFLLQQLQNQ